MTDKKVTLKHGKVPGVETSHKISVSVCYNSSLIPTEVSPKLLWTLSDEIQELASP